jgi:hypothetical protein
MSYSRQQRAVFCRDLPLLKCLFFGEGRAASLHAAAARERSSNFLYYRRSSRNAAIMTTTLHVSVICEGQAALFLYRALLLLKCLLQGTSGVHILHTAFTARQFGRALPLLLLKRLWHFCWLYTIPLLKCLFFCEGRAALLDAAVGRLQSTIRSSRNNVERRHRSSLRVYFFSLFDSDDDELVRSFHFVVTSFLALLTLFHFLQ